MKRTIILAAALWFFSATFAFAGKIVSPNPSYGQPIKVIYQWAIGNQRMAVFTVDSCVNGQKTFAVFSVWYNHFTHETTVQLDGSVVTGTCP